MPNPTAAMLVIGDEILSGRTRDANMYHLAGQLTGQGIDLKEVRVVSDDPEAIVNATRALSAAYTHVFTSGGIGPTHDDITADCIAAAFGVSIGVRADARAILQAHYDANGQERDLVFLDPPYGKSLGQQALRSAWAQGWIAADALVIFEEASAMTPEGFVLRDSRKFGGTTMTFLQPIQAPAESDER